MKVMSKPDHLLIKKITAPNGGVFTGGGTNTYIIGINDITIIDPGPIEESHAKNILDTYGDRIKRILVTHTHMDHSPLATPLSKELDVPLMGMTILDNMNYQDESFRPSSHLQDGDLIETGEYTIEVVHTPGHASNHLCYLIKDNNCLITGDHIMQGSTVVIAPPDGNMRDYLLSLEKLKNYKIDFLAPGHGEYIDKPFEAVDWIVNHRLEREAKVLKKLQKVGKISLNDLVLEVYDDVDSRLHKIALASLEAHLFKLQEEKAAEFDGSFWSCIN